MFISELRSANEHVRIRHKHY